MQPERIQTPRYEGSSLGQAKYRFWWISRQGVARELTSPVGSSYYLSSKSLDTIHRPIRHLNVCAKSVSYENPVVEAPHRAFYCSSHIVADTTSSQAPLLVQPCAPFTCA